MEDYTAVAEVGFPNFCERKALPSSFTVTCRLIVKERAHDRLTIKVKSLKELMAKHKKGQAATGNVYMHKDGSTWLLYLYPCGNSSAKPDFLSLYAKVLSIPDVAKNIKFDGQLTFTAGAEDEESGTAAASPRPIFQK